MKKKSRSVKVKKTIKKSRTKKLSRASKSRTNVFKRIGLAVLGLAAAAVAYLLITGNSYLLNPSTWIAEKPEIAAISEGECITQGKTELCKIDGKVKERNLTAAEYSASKGNYSCITDRNICVSEKEGCDGNKGYVNTTGDCPNKTICCYKKPKAVPVVESDQPTTAPPTNKCTPTLIARCKEVQRVCNESTGLCEDPSTTTTTTTTNLCTPTLIDLCEKTQTVCNPSTGLCDDTSTAPTTTAPAELCNAATIFSCQLEGGTCDPATGDCLARGQIATTTTTAPTTTTPTTTIKCTAAVKKECANQQRGACIEATGKCEKDTIKCTDAVKKECANQQRGACIEATGKCELDVVTTTTTSPVVNPGKQPLDTNCFSNDSRCESGYCKPASGGDWFSKCAPPGSAESGTPVDKASECESRYAEIIYGQLTCVKEPTTSVSTIAKDPDQNLTLVREPDTTTTTPITRDPDQNLTLVREPDTTTTTPPTQKLPTGGKCRGDNNRCESGYCQEGGFLKYDKCAPVGTITRDPDQNLTLVREPDTTTTTTSVSTIARDPDQNLTLVREPDTTTTTTTTITRDPDQNLAIVREPGTTTTSPIAKLPTGGKCRGDNNLCESGYCQEGGFLKYDKCAFFDTAPTPDSNPYPGGNQPVDKQPLDTNCYSNNNRCESGYCKPATGVGLSKCARPPVSANSPIAKDPDQNTILTGAVPGTEVRNASECDSGKAIEINGLMTCVADTTTTSVSTIAKDPDQNLTIVREPGTTTTTTTTVTAPVDTSGKKDNGKNCFSNSNSCKSGYCKPATGFGLSKCETAPAPAPRITRDPDQAATLAPNTTGSVDEVPGNVAKPGILRRFFNWLKGTGDTVVIEATTINCQEGATRCNGDWLERCGQYSFSTSVDWQSVKSCENTPSNIYNGCEQKSPTQADCLYK